MNPRKWLIRTHEKNILGPVGQEKIIELIEKGELTEKDEISSGNGYWFWIKEKDLLDKYLYKNTPQSFNPVSEVNSPAPSATRSPPEPDVPPPPPKTARNDYYLLVLVFLLIAVLTGFLWYYGTVLNKFSLFSQVHAQENNSLIKKKS